MQPDEQSLTARAVEIFSMNNGSWSDYAFVTDIEPPRIVRALPSIGLLDIADEALAQACRDYLTEQGAQNFGSFDELASAFGIKLSTDNGMETYSSPAGFYTVQHPVDWKVSRDENIVNIYPPDGSGAVTISAFRGEGVSSLVLKGMIERTFKNNDVVSSMRPISQNNCDGLQTEFSQSTKEGLRVWLVIGMTFGKVLVLITANDGEEAMSSRRQIYESILGSLVLSDPEESRG